RRKLNRGRVVIAILALLVLLSLILYLRITVPKTHLKPLFSALMRLKYWQQTLLIIRAFPWTGVGLGNFNLIHSRYSHNSYLQIWAEMGIFGLASFLWLIFAISREALKNMGSSSHKKEIAVLSAAGAAFLLHNLLDFSFFLPEVAFIWWVILGLLYSYHS
ncbi:MAG TPA: O-antigen ligase family protein, partial [Candidatus Margulisiibacteriota bacterium]|nr:O-antigen ligase family protein [Candidatus Margulisiibacteriota bacterium]